MNFDDQWVDEVQRGIKACGVFMWYPIYCSWTIPGIFDCRALNFCYVGLTYNQLNNNLTSQAATMTLNGLPNDVLSNLDPFALIILIPVCDLLVSFQALRKTNVMGY